MTSFSAGQEAAPIHNPLTEQQHMAGRANSATVAVNMRTGEAELKGRTTYNAYEDQMSRPGVMASYDPYNKGSVVVDGMRTSVAVAARLGAIVADGQGGWKDAPSLGNAEPVTPAPNDSLTPPEAGPAPAEHFSEAEWSAYENDIADLPQVAYDSTVALATVACLDGSDLEGAVTRLARETGMEPARAREHVTSAYGMYEDTVVRSIASEGVAAHEAPGFFQWCRGQRGLQSAISSLTVQRDTKPFQALARQYSAFQARHTGANS